MRGGHLLWLMLASCDRVFSSALSTTCEPRSLFGEPRRFDALSTDTLHEGGARLVGDETTLLYHSTDENVQTTNMLFKADRPTSSDAFGEPTLLSSVPGLVTLHPTTTDELSPIVVEGYRDGGFFLKLAIARSDGTFEQLEPASTSLDGGPYLAGRELWFASTRAGNTAIFTMQLGDNFERGPVSEPVLRSDDGYIVNVPVISEDGSTLYFSSNRENFDFDIWMAQRTDDGTFGTPTIVTELSSDSADYPSWISPDMCRFYFSSDRNGSYDIWMAEREP